MCFVKSKRDRKPTICFSTVSQHLLSLLSWGNIPEYTQKDSVLLEKLRPIAFVSQIPELLDWKSKSKTLNSSAETPHQGIADILVF